MVIKCTFLYLLTLQFKLLHWCYFIKLHPTRRLHATCSELPRNHIISKLHVVFNGCAEVSSKLREVFLLGIHYLKDLFKYSVSSGKFNGDFEFFKLKKVRWNIGDFENFELLQALKKDNFSWRL